MNLEEIKKHPKAYEIFKSIFKTNPEVIRHYIKYTWNFVIAYYYPSNNKVYLKIESMREYKECVEYYISDLENKIFNKTKERLEIEKESKKRSLEILKSQINYGKWK